MYPPAAHPLNIIRSTGYKAIYVSLVQYLLQKKKKKSLPYNDPYSFGIFTHFFCSLALFFILFFGLHSLAPHKSHKSPLIVNISHTHTTLQTRTRKQPPSQTTNLQNHEIFKNKNPLRLLLDLRVQQGYGNKECSMEMQEQKMICNKKSQPKEINEKRT